MFVVVEVNLMLWLALFGATFSNQGSTMGADKAVFSTWVIYVGVGFAAVVQHWAYYAVRREANSLM